MLNVHRLKLQALWILKLNYDLYKLFNYKLNLQVLWILGMQEWGRWPTLCSWGVIA